MLIPASVIDDQEHDSIYDEFKQFYNKMKHTKVKKGCYASND